MRIFLLPSFLIMLFSCGPGEDAIQGGVLGQEKMVDLLVAMHKADAEKQVGATMYPDSTRADTVNYDDVFRACGTTRAVFDSSMKFYSSKPALLNKLYDEVIMRLNQEETELQGSKK